jgi:hypothetical protein
MGVVLVTRERVRWRRIVIVVASVVTGMMVFATLGWLLYYRSVYGTFALWQTPPRIEYCGREYDRGATVVAIPSDRELVPVMTIEPAGLAVYAEQPTHEGMPPVANLPCAMGLAVSQDDHYLLYGLSGGP